MQIATPTLLETQRAFRRSLVGHDDADATAHILPDGLDAIAQLAIYRNTMTSVLTNALRLSYPAVERLVGTKFFAAAAERFIERHLPPSACLDDYGAEFPEFLARFPPAATLAYLGDVARLEWGVNRALHAPDADALDLARLGQLSEADRGRVCFLPHPALSLAYSDYPVDQIWRAVLEQDDGALGAIDFSDAPVWLVVRRGLSGIEVSRMSESAWRFTAELCAGHPLHVALDACTDVDGVTVLAEHLTAGLFIAFGLDDSANAAKD